MNREHEKAAIAAMAGRPADVDARIEILSREEGRLHFQSYSISNPSDVMYRRDIARALDKAYDEKASAEKKLLHASNSRRD